MPGSPITTAKHSQKNLILPRNTHQSGPEFNHFCRLTQLAYFGGYLVQSFRMDTGWLTTHCSVEPEMPTASLGPTPSHLTQSSVLKAPDNPMS